MTLRNTRRGFTLLEVVVALAVMVVIASLAWGTLSGALQMRDFIAAEGELERSSRVAMDRIEREIRLAYLTPNTDSINTYKTVFVGKDESEADQLWFATKAHRRKYQNARECDQSEVTLFTDDDPDHDGRLVLLHRESPRVDHEPDKQGAVQPLARNVTRFELRYLDQSTGEWQDEWDSEGAEFSGRLPRAVQVVLAVMGPDPDDPDEESERAYVKTIVLENAKPMSWRKLEAYNADGGDSDSSSSGSSSNSNPNVPASSFTKPPLLGGR